MTKVYYYGEHPNGDTRDLLQSSDREFPSAEGKEDHNRNQPRTVSEQKLAELQADRVNQREGNNIHSLVQSIQCSVHRIQTKKGEIIHFISPEFSDISPNKDEGMQIIKDFQGTFPLLIHSLKFAIKLAQEGKNNIVVKAFAHDLSNEDFIACLEEQIKNGLNPKSVTIELLRDDYGILNHRAVDNIKQLQKLGFGFAVHDFHDEQGTIFTRYIHKLHTSVLPRFVHISNRIIHGLKSGALRLSIHARDVLDVLKKKGVSLFVSEETDSSTSQLQPLSPYCMELLNRATIIPEHFIDMQGKVQGTEGLVRFHKGIQVQEGLDILKRGQGTVQLVEKGVLASISDILIGRRRSINVYIKDLGDKRFRETINKIIQRIPIECRGYLIFEILEDRYGALNEQVIKNIAWLQEMGFKIAIDDLNISSNTDGMSVEILNSLIDEGIGVDIVKIDGEHSEAIRSGDISNYELRNLQQLIKQGIPGKHGQQNPIYIIEWIKSKVHAIQVSSALGIDPNIQCWYQGRDLQPAEFRKLTEKSI